MQVLMLRNVAERPDLIEGRACEVSDSEGAELIRRVLAVAVQVQAVPAAVPGYQAHGVMVAPESVESPTGPLDEPMPVSRKQRRK